jgi:hypothetical protein
MTVMDSWSRCELDDTDPSSDRLNAVTLRRKSYWTSYWS